MRITPLLFLLPLLAGCRREDVHVYRIAKDDSSEPAGISALIASVPMESEPPMADAAQTPPSSLELSWKVPAGWKESPASGMRLASFSSHGADISVIAIPGMAGGELANVNRWRGQLGLGPVSDQDLKGLTTRVRAPAGSILVVDFNGVDPKGEIQGQARMVGAILPFQDKQWFFKLMGPASQVAQAKTSFLEFLRSVRRASNS